MFISQREDGVILSLKVTPKAKQVKVVFDNIEDEYLKVFVGSVPENGEANKDVIKLLAKTFNLQTRTVVLLSGTTSRMKRVLLEDQKIEEILAYLRNFAKKQ